MHSRGRETNSTKIQALANSVKFLHILWSGVCQDIPFKVKDRLVHDAATTTMTVKPPWALDATHSTPRKTAPAHISGNVEGASFE